jgi:hypothetical protein
MAEEEEADGSVCDWLLAGLDGGDWMLPRWWW